MLHYTEVFRLCYNAGMDNTVLPLWSLFIIIPLAVWTLFWKALALWHAARRGNTAWFIVLFLVNTAGILDIIYLIIAGKLKIGGLFSKSDSSSSTAQ